jgi:general secretion pathway protein D
MKPLLPSAPRTPLSAFLAATPKPHRHTPPLWALSPLVLALCLGQSAWAQTTGDSDPPMPVTKSRAPVTLNFVNADIEAVSRAIGTMLDRQIVVDVRVRGQITLTSEKPQSPQEAWRSYLAALRGLSFTVVENAGLLKVVPEAEAKLQAGTVSVNAPTARGDQVLTQIFRLNHENPNNLVPLLRPLITANNTINANVGNGSLIITDYADNLQRLAKIIAALDQPAASEIEVVPVRYALASDLAPLIQKLSDSVSAAPGTPSPPQGASTTVIVEPRTNSLIVRAANPTRMAAAKSLIQKLDRELPGGGPVGNIWVVYLKNADAVKLAEVLRAAMASGAAATGASSGGSSSSGSVARQPASVPGINGISGSQGGQSSAASSPVSASAGPSTGGQIQADPATNSLIISAPEAVYRQMRQVIDQLDTRRAQVYVETMIVKVDADKAAEFGIQWQGIIGNTKNSSVGYAGTNFGNTANIASLTLSQFGGAATTTTTGTTPSLGQGLNLGLLNKVNGVFTLGALANFLQTKTGANILSTPNLVALDNEEAKIVIGSNVPFVTGSFTNTGSSNGSVNPFQTVERKDVGITLKIKSQIGEAGTVRMTVFQESSSLRTDNSSITDKSSIETTVVVDDGQTMVLGGLLKDEYGDSDSRIPGLGDIPYLGALFRSEGRKRVKSNLMLFLRPVVIRTPSDASRLTVDRYDAIRAVQESAQPEDKMLMPIEGAPLIPERRASQPVPASPATTPPINPN